MKKFFSLHTAWNWLKKQYPLLLLFVLCVLWLWALIGAIKDPVFPYHYDKMSTFLVLGLDLSLPIYSMVAACWYLNRPHAWRNTAKIIMQCTLAGTVFTFIDLYCLVTPWAVMNDFLSVVIIDETLPTLASIHGLYKIHTGSTFTPRQVVRYVLALTLGSSVGSIGLFLWFSLFQHQ